MLFVRLSQNFKREEQNFVVQNEINNLGFLTGEAKTKMSKVNRREYAFGVYNYHMIDIAHVNLV